LLLTGEIPTTAQVAELTQDLRARSSVPEWVTKLQTSLPKDLHPMSQFNIAINALQKDSVFAKSYQSGLAKGKYWEATYDDALNLIAKLPNVASTIYRHSFKGGEVDFS